MAIAFAKSVPQTNSQQSKCDDLLPQDQKMCLNKVILQPPPNSRFLLQKWKKKIQKRRKNKRKYILFLGHQDGEIRHAPKNNFKNLIN